MTWAGHRKKHLPGNWETLRQRVLQRDGYQCQAHVSPSICGAHANQVDHVSRGDDHSLANLQALCSYHHRLKSSAEGNAARAKRTRPPEQHPGLVR